MRSKFLKNLQWKKKLKRLGALGLCALLIAGNLTIPDVAKAASSEAGYPAQTQDTVIENALTYFQYFTKDNLTLGDSTHTVGALAVGGNFKLGNFATFGDGAMTASYAKHVVSAIPPNLASGFPGVCNDVYYESTDMSGEQLAGFTQKPGYMDMSELFNMIEAGSAALLTGAEELKTVEDNKIVVDFITSEATSAYTINYATLKEAKYIDININLDDLDEKKFVINITGLDSNNSFDADSLFMMFGSDSANGASGNNQVGILFNGQPVPAIKNMAAQNGNTQDGQFYLEGMKLIFNFPDYEGTLQTKGFEGHIVAPKAKVIPGGGTLEGGVIAREIFVDSTSNDAQSVEAHYYPFNKPTEHYGCVEAGTSGIVPDAIILDKIYQDANGSTISLNDCPAEGQGAKFTLYSYENGQKGEAVVSDVEVKLYNGKHQLHILGSNLELGKRYLLVETTPAQGYETSNVQYVCRVDEKGDIYYSADGAGETRIVPQCVNKKLAVQPGEIHVIVNTTDNTVVSDVPVTLKQGDVEVKKLNTDENGAVTFTNVTPGEGYTVSIPQEISGYQKLENNVSGSMTVNAGATINIEFTLEKEVQQQPTTGSITVTVKKDDGNGEAAMEGVTVQVTGGPTSVSDTTTDAEGAVKHDSLGFGAYTVTIPAQDGYTITSENPQSAELTAQQPDETKEFVLVKNGSLDVTVSCGENGVDGVSVTINKKDAVDNTTAKTGTTTNGTVSFDDLEPGEYTVTISNVPDNYTVVGNTTSKDATVPVGNKGTSKFELEEKVTNSITVVVKDEENNPVSNVAVVVQDSQGGQPAVLATGTDPDGKASVSSVTPGQYTATITAPSGYVYVVARSQTDYVDGDEQKEFEFVLAKTGTITIKVVDSATGEVVEKIAVAEGPLFGDNGIIGNTQHNMMGGTTKIKDVARGTYSYELTDVPDGYKLTDPNETTKEVTVNPYNLNERDKELIFYVTEEQPQVQTGKIIVEVKENTVNGEGIDGVSVTVTSKDDSNVIFMEETKNGGTVTFDNLPEGDYIVSTEGKDGYTILGDDSCEVKVDSEQDATAQFILQQNGTIKINVTCDGTGVEGVEVEVTPYPGSGDSQPYKTDSNGQITIEDVSPDGYTVKVKDKDGYTITGDNPKTSTVTAGGESTYNFTLVQQPATLKVVVKDENDELIDDVEVVVKDLNDNYREVVNSVTKIGEVYKEDIKPSKYSVVITAPEGYTYVNNKSSEVREINAGEDAVFEFTLAKTATLTIKVIDTQTDNLVDKSSYVEINKDNNGILQDFAEKNVPKSDVVKVDVTKGTYSVSLTPPTNYNWVDSSYEMIDVNPDLESQYEMIFYVAQTRKIEVTVTKDSQPVVNPDLTIRVKGQDDTYKDHTFGPSKDDDGIVLFDRIPLGDYEVVLKVPGENGGTVTYSKTGTLEENETIDEVKFDLSTSSTLDTGTILISVKDDNPNGGEFVPGVNVTVKDSDDNTIYTGTTTREAAIEIPELEEGNYTVTVGNVKNHVLVGDNDVEQEVKKDGITYYDFVLSRRCTLKVEVWDKTTEQMIASPKISVSNGSDVREEREDVSEFTLTELKAGKYTATIEAPDGYVLDGEATKSESFDPYTGGTHNEPHTLKFYVVESGTITVNVKETDENGNPISNVPVTLQKKDVNGDYTNYGTEQKTETGTVTFENLPDGEYKVVIPANNTGYKTLENSECEKEVSITPNDTTGEATFYLTPVGKLEIHVKDDNPAGSSYVDGVPVTVEDEKGNSVSIGSQTTAGVITLDDLTPGEYTVTIGDKNGYIVKNNQKTITKTVNAGDTATVYDFTLAKYATLEIDIYDITTGTPIHLDGDGDVIAKIEILRDSQSFNTKSLTYGNSEYVGVLNGQYQTTLTDLPEGYQVVSEDGETVVTDIDPYDPNGPADGTYKVVFNVIKCGTVTVDVKENNENGDPVEDVKVTLYLDKGNHNYEIFGSEQTTGTDGTVTFTDVPVRDYKVVISKENDGYEDLTDTECTKEGSFDQNLTAEESFYLTPEQATPTTGSLRVTVVEKGTTNNVPGVTVTITNTEDDSTMQRYITTNDTNGGVLLFNNIPTGTYIVEATPSVTGYKTLTGAQSKCEVEVKVTPQATHTFEYEPEQAAATGLLEVTVVEKGTTTGIDGVTVTVVDSKGGTHTADTNGNGHASFNNLPIGSCVITIPAKVDGYETLAENANKDTTVVIEGNVEKTSKFELKTEKTADLIITVTDEKTNDPVPGAKVKITKPAPANGTTSQGESEIKETGNDGRIVMKGLPKGKYTTTVVSVPEGYNVTTNKEITVELDPETAPEAQVDYKVGQVGALKVTITEKGTTNGIYGVQVAITTNASGTEKTVYTYTDANGQVNLAGQEVGTYKISIPTSIAGYKELDAAYVVQTKDVEVNKTTEYAFEVEKVTTADPDKGDAEITVTDEVTGKPVPGASVIVTAPDNTTRKYTTDGNGVISMPQQKPGEYKVEVIEVPAGYTVTQNQQTTIMVVAGSTVKTEIKVKPTDSAGDSNEGVSGGTGEAQPDNGGTTDNNGGTVNTGGTSNSTGDVVNTGGATDSNTGGVITTGQTDGATNNKTTDSQSVSKQPKTGDETNPGIIWIILSVSACLAAASVIGLVYVKKKED